ncbi:membrane fusion protein, adhesin transport system [Novimethylophilus kurashikiensis]|uniref:Membrane fusion protein (MFP) family protein n=1 Tax=Novimethylophilus kurashikiensis TaxID=1825523 RepID=A0A2R5FAH0_9PROT|nr:HlyD family type I secretion periplasmic adaptor subunit [Novimethylophilus kurashikiensis]GBG15216.1 membrane fusion protein, adhesin transport system [Novimethylophilus kurashikiensis]
MSQKTDTNVAEPVMELVQPAPQPPKKPEVVNPADLDLLSDSNAALFQSTPHFASMITKGVLAFILVFFVWAYFAQIDEITVGEGKVIPSSQVQVIQNLEGGIVSAIPVKVGDLVHKGDIVMRLDPTRFSSSLGETQAKHDALVAKVARLEAESTGQAFQAPADLLKTNPQLISEERMLMVNRQQELETALTVLRQQADQRQQEVSEKKARVKQLEESYNLVSQELKMSKPLAAQGVMSDVEILRLERQLSDVKGEMDEARLAIPRLEQAIGEAKSKISASIAKFRSDAANDLNTARAELASTSATSIAAVDRLTRTEVRAPVTGFIKQLKVTTVGGVIQPGMEVMEIVPLEDTLLIETKIRPSDVGFIRPGQEATVKITAYDFSIFGGLDAEVENITADTITTEKGDKSESFYLVRVRTKSTTFSASKKKLPIMPGMMATVHIRTGKKTILQYLLKPIIKAKSDALRER